jgi:hypothetical protein
MLLVTHQVLAQLHDDFNDGDFTANPEWAGDATKFIVSSGVLRLQAPALNDKAYLTAASHAINDAAWEFYVKLDFNPSSTNYSRIYLVADNADITQSLNGYYVMLGNTTDEISLYCQTGTTRTKIIDGTDGRLNVSVCEVKIKVTRNVSGEWELFSDFGLTGTYTLEGTIVDATHTSTAFFGIECVYTSTRNDKFYFDDITITGNPEADNHPPTLETVTVLSSTELELKFSEDLESISASNVQNFSIEGDVHPQKANLTSDASVVRLTFRDAFVNGKEDVLTVVSVEDIAGNQIAPTEKNFLYFVPQPINFKDIVITELFPDFTPSVGLPDQEFVEILNRSTNAIDLNGWKISDGSSTGIVSSKIILSGEYLILTSTTGQSKFLTHGEVIGVTSFPSLNNANDRLILTDANGQVIDSVAYNSDWYRDEDKSDGGWTLELIDQDNFCKGDDNWKASNNPAGGTPGKQNSVFEKIIDVQGPHVVNAVMTDSVTIELTFNESLQTKVLNAKDLIVNPPALIENITFAKDDRKTLNIHVSKPLEDERTYAIDISNVSDCSGNKVLQSNAIAYVNLDTISPNVKEVLWSSANRLTLILSERIVRIKAEDTHNYVVNDLQQKILSAKLSQDEKQIELAFQNPFTNGVDFIMTIKALEDINGNVSSNLKTSIRYFESLPASCKDIIITEIFPDPSPVIGLPEAEFIEIHNRSEKPFNLKDWTISDGSSVGRLSQGIILPGHYEIVTSASSAVSFQEYGNVITTTNFPTLNNSADAIVLKTPGGQLIDSVYYTSDWYRSDDLGQGGYTLELIDTQNICAEETNWTASEDLKGGTPGKQNSVFANKPDVAGPELLSIIALDETSLLISFNEKLDADPPSPGAIHITENQVTSVDLSPSLKSLCVKLATSLQKGHTYHLTASDVYDCAGNKVSPNHNQSAFGLPERAEPMDVVINEVLFNPTSTGTDFIEVYNRSKKFINLKNWTVSNFEEDSLFNKKVIVGDHMILAPDQYVVLTTEPELLASEYPLSPKETFLKVDALPSMTDDEGTIAIIDSTAQIIDAFQYTDDMHSVFIKDDEGVSLERIHPDKETQLAANWKSASSTVGYATPGYKNSNSVDELAEETESIVVEPEIFQPRSGYQDFALIKYSFESGGYVANVTIYDAQGREVKRLANNEVLGTEGFLRWDGDNERGEQARIGSYIVYFEVFNETGTIKKFMKRVAIASRF